MFMLLLRIIGLSIILALGFLIGELIRDLLRKDEDEEDFFFF